MLKVIYKSNTRASILPALVFFCILQWQNSFQLNTGYDSVHIDLVQGRNAIMTIEDQCASFAQEIDDLFVQMLLPLRQHLMSGDIKTVDSIKLLNTLYWAYNMADTSRHTLEFATFMVKCVSGWSGINNVEQIAVNMAIQLKTIAFNNSVGILWTKQAELYCVNNLNITDASVIAFYTNGDVVRYDFGNRSNGVWHHFVVPIFISARTFDGTIEYLSDISNLAQTNDIKRIKVAYEAFPDGRQNKKLWEYVMAQRIQ